MKLFKCDKCGKEFKLNQLLIDDGEELVIWELRYNQWVTPIAEICYKCKYEFDEVINKFFGRDMFELEKKESL